LGGNATNGNKPQSDLVGGGSSRRRIAS
jgi:hypothetical protein